MSEQLNMAGYLLKLKKKQDQKEFLEELIERETKKQNHLINEIENIMEFYSIEKKKEQIDKMFEQQKQEFDVFNQYHLEILRKYAFLSHQTQLMQEVDHKVDWNMLQHADLDVDVGYIDDINENKNADLQDLYDQIAQMECLSDEDQFYLKYINRLPNKL